MGVKTKSLNKMYDDLCIKMVNKILKYSNHPLYSSFVSLDLENDYVYRNIILPDIQILFFYATKQYNFK